MLFSAAMQSAPAVMYWEERERQTLRLALEYAACIIKDRTLKCIIVSYDERSPVRKTNKDKDGLCINCRHNAKQESQHTDHYLDRL